MSMCRRFVVVGAGALIGHNIGRNLDDQGSAFRGTVRTHLTTAMVAAVRAEDTEA